MTAAAIAAFIETGQADLPIGKKTVKVHTTGGDFNISFNHNTDKDNYSDIWLRGPAKLVFEGMVSV